MKRKESLAVYDDFCRISALLRNVLLHKEFDTLSDYNKDCLNQSKILTDNMIQYLEKVEKL